MTTKLERFLEISGDYQNNNITDEQHEQILKDEFTTKDLVALLSLIGWSCNLERIEKEIDNAQAGGI